MRKLLVLALSLILVLPAVASAQDSRAALERVGKALGDVKTFEMIGSGSQFAVGQAFLPGDGWPEFKVRQIRRAGNYDTGAMIEETFRTRALDPPRGGAPFTRGEARLQFFLQSEYAWNIVNDNPVPAPITLLDRQMQLWTSPHGLVKAALANNGTMQGNMLSFTVAGKFKVKASVDGQNLPQRVDAVLANPVLGDMPVEITYADYKDFGGVKFPTRIRQVYGGYPALDLTITEARTNVAVDVNAPDAVKAAANIYSKVASEQAADGIWYITGGSHHSVLFEMKDYTVLFEAPLNDERALAAIGEARKLVPGKPLRYLIVSHQHFDHAGGVRAAVGEGLTVITSDSNRAFLEKALATPATVRPDHLAKSGKKATVEGFKDRRVLTDGTRTVEIRHITGSLHAGDLLMVYFSKEKIISEADAFTPPAPTAPPPTGAPNPFTVNLVENLQKQGITADKVLPLHGRIVPVADLMKAAGHAH